MCSWTRETILRFYTNKYLNRDDARVITDNETGTWTMWICYGNGHQHHFNSPQNKYSEREALEYALELLREDARGNIDLDRETVDSDDSESEEEEEEAFDNDDLHDSDSDDPNDLGDTNALLSRTMRKTIMKATTMVIPTLGMNQTVRTDFLTALAKWVRMDTVDNWDSPGEAVCRCL